MLRWTSVSATVALTALLSTGCATGRGAGPGPSERPSSSFPDSSHPPSPDPASTPPRSSGTELPTLKPPSMPPRTPTDTLPTDWIVGTVTVGGDGPCYGMETNDGKQYALYDDGGIKLVRGATIRVKIEPLELKIYCGPGDHASVVKIEIVR